MKPVILPANAPETRARRVAEFFRLAMRLDPEKSFQLLLREQTRSLKQNAYIWSVCYPTIRRFFRDQQRRAYTDKAIHAALKELFLPHTVEQMPHGEVKVYLSTTELTTTQFIAYVDCVHHWAAELGCVIPDPDKDFAKKRGQRRAESA